MGMRRRELHGMMVEAAAACGVKMLWNTPVRGIEGETVRAGKERVRARWIVGADGSQSQVRRWSGLEAGRYGAVRYASRRHYGVRPWTSFTEIHWGRGMQGYVTPVGPEDVCVVLITERRETTWEEAWKELPRLAEEIGDAEMKSAERGAVTGTHRLERVQRGNVALVGDASGGVDAITGEGLRLSFRQALELAEAMGAEELGSYERAHRRLGRGPGRVGRVLLNLGRHRMVRRRAMKTLRARPELFGKLLAIQQGESSAGELAEATARLVWGLLEA